MMKLGKKDIGKYYLVYDNFDALEMVNICKFIEVLDYARHYPYKMHIIEGRWKGADDIVREYDIIKELSCEEALAMAI